MVFFWQIFKILKLFVTFLTALAKLLDSKTPKKEEQESIEEIEKVATEIESKEKEDIPSKEKKSEVLIPEEDDVLPAKKNSSSVISDLATLAGFTAGFLGVVYLLNRFLVPTYNKDQRSLSGELSHFKVDDGILAYYTDGEGPPLIMIHSLTPGSSSYQMEVIYNKYRMNRTVYALDLLGYGLSERPDIVYSPDLYMRHINEFASMIKTKHHQAPDIIAFGLSTEYTVALADENPDLFNKLILISPTGLENDVNSIKFEFNRAALLFFRLPIVGQGVFNLITSKPVLKQYLANRIFVESRNMSYIMLQQYYHTTHVNGAKNAPSFFVAGELVVNDLFQKYLNIKTPTMIICGTGSERYSKYNAVSTIVKNNEIIQQKTIENGGLLVHVEKPDQFFATADHMLNS